MPFTHDTESALQAAAALVNTTRDPADDALATLADLDEFVRDNEYSGTRAHDRDELVAVQSLRSPVGHLWDLSTEELVDAVNAMLVDTAALPQLVRHDEWDWHLHATPSDAPLATRMKVEIAMALVDLVRAGETDRLKRCAADDCTGVLVDLSRNRSRRFCSTTCSNRVAAAAYRSRSSHRA